MIRVGFWGILDHNYNKVPENTADDINPALPALRTLNHGNYGIFVIMGSAGFISSTVVLVTT